MRRSLLLACTGLYLLLLSGCHGGLVAPQSPRTLRVLTYNIHHGEGTDEVFDYERQASLINRLSPDLVALQEVDRGTGRAGGVDQAAVLARLCDMHHVFGQAMPYDGGQYGEAVLSRFPIERTVVHPLPHQADQEPRAALDVHVRPEGIGPLRFVGTHLCHQSGETRLQQVLRLRRLFHAEEGPPVILAGDLNARPGSEPMRTLLASGWRDVVAPRSVIDYVLVREADSWRICEVRIPDEPVASDHDPVLVVLEWMAE